MAREYKVEVTRDGEVSELYIHDDDTVEIVIAENNVKADYLIKKQIQVKDLVNLFRLFNVESFEVTKV